MVAQGGGAIVNISSNFAVAGVGVRSVYCAAKAAVDSLTRSFAVEWAPLGVRVNAIAPGTMNTPGYERARRDAPQMVESVIAATPSGRIADPRGGGRACRLPALGRVRRHDRSGHRRGRRSVSAARRARDSPAGAGRRRRLTDAASRQGAARA